MLKRYLPVIFGIFVLQFVLSGCNAKPTEPPSANITVIAPTPTLNKDAYPAPSSSEAYPAPTHINAYPEPGSGQLPPATKVVPTAVPQTPDPNLGVVKGRLLLVEQPVDAVVLYLAKVITSDTGGRMVRFDRANSLRAVTDDQGNFFFGNVLPGEYGLVLDRIIDSYLLLTPEGDNFIITIVANEQIDLGALNYEDLPIPSEQLEQKLSLLGNTYYC